MALSEVVLEIDMDWKGKSLLCLFFLMVIAIGVSLLVTTALDNPKSRMRQTYSDGREAGKSGVPLEACPWEDTNGLECERSRKREQWKKGWIEGFKERKHGTERSGPGDRGRDDPRGR